MEEQDLFYNIAVQVYTEHTPLDLLRLVQNIEQKVGRTPSERNGPREIDIDILLFDHLILHTPELEIPHPRMHERAFVLVPLEEIASMAYHPGLDTHIVDLWDKQGGGAEAVWESDEAFDV